MLRRAHLGVPACSVATESPANSASAFASAPTTHGIVENNAASPSVGVPVTGDDPHSDPLSCALESTGAASFEIISSNGHTRTTRGVTDDHEAKCSFAVRVEADDGTGGDTNGITVSATDLDEKPSTHPAPTLADVRNSDMPGLGERHTSRAGQRSKVNPMTLANGLRPSIQFVAVTALLLSLAGAPAAAKDGSVPARPTGLSTVATHESVTLTWNAPDDDSITHYKVLRREPKAHAAYGFVAIEDDTGSAATRYTDDTVKPGKRYIYRVKAVNPHGVSTVSRHARAITPAAPAPEPAPLTAGFVGMPAEHDGESGIRFRVALSENIGISFRALREDAFTVSGGRVTGGRRVDGRRDLFEMTVRPESFADVTITLPAGRECGVSGAICTKGENRRKLTNTPTATVAGPEGSYENSPATGAPTIVGTAQVGETLTAQTSGIADADGLSNPNFAYQWVSCGGPTDVCILGATDSTYTLVADDAGKSVKVIVSFVDDAGNPESLTSNVAAVSSTPPPTGEPQPPGAPGMPQDSLTYHVEDGRNWVTFRWMRASGVVEGYEVLRRQNTRLENEWRVIARIDDPDAISYEDHTVIESSDYFFAVRSFNSAGRSGVVASTDCRNLDSVIAEGSQGLAYPENVRGRLTENGTAILLTWTAPTRGYHGQDVSPATGYQILRWDLRRGYPNYDIHVENTSSTETSYVDWDITPDNTFLYTVRAWNDWGLGDRSFSATVKTMDLDVIGAPRNFRVSSSSEGAALTWDAPEDVADTDLSYRIYRREHSGATVPLVLLASDHGATSYTDGTVVPGTEYHYQVRVDGDPLDSRHGIPTKLRRGFYAAPHDLSVAPAAPDADPAALSVADARAREGTDETIDFRVSLSRAMSAAVTVDYATADGRGMAATAVEDYTPVSGTLTFAPGETAKTVAVAILDDVIDEGEEGFALRLSNARGARIADAVGFGWIVNSDPLQKMWLSRFGRTVAGHVVDAVAGRLSGPSPGSQVTLGGQTIDLAALSSGTGDARRTLAGALGAERAANDDDPLAGPGAWEASSAGSRAGPQTDGATSRTLTGRELLRGSSFHLAAGGGEAGGPGFAAWGRVTVGGFDAKTPAEAGTVRLDGEVTTGVLGADAEWERWLAGVAVSVSEGEGRFDQPGVDSGTVESTLTSVNPYVRVTLSDRVSAWGLVGYGTGDMTMTQAATEARGEVATRTDLSMRLGAVGARGALLEAGETGGLDLALRGDAFLVQMESEKAANTVATKAQASRLRLVLEGSRAFALGEGAVLTPGLEVGLRHDGGDAETGTGIEVGGRIRYTDAGSGLTAEANARTLIAHEDSGYGEWGAGGSVRLDPGASGRGLSLTVAPEWGTPSSGVERLWSARGTAGLVRDEDFEATRRLDAELGYGLGAPRGLGLVTPYAGLSLADGGGRAWRTGARWQVAPDVTFGFEGTRSEPANDDEAPQHGVMLRGTIRW